MKKTEFKKILKPIVAECIQESLMEDGLISGIIAEVVKGMATPASITKMVEAAPDPVSVRMKKNAFNKKQTRQLQEQRNKLMSAVGKTAYNGVNLFEGTTPAAAGSTDSQSTGVMSGQAPHDPGVDISNLFGAVSQHWNAHMSDVKVNEEK
tara:strand:+ start:508 stop:960 length:453 start_codon:yes stop_codon:yes gene_type:complete